MSRHNHDIRPAREPNGDAPPAAPVLFRTPEEVLTYLRAAAAGTGATHLTASMGDDAERGLIAEVAAAVLEWSEREDPADLDGLDSHLRLRVGGRAAVHLLPGDTSHGILVLDRPEAVPVVVLGTDLAALRAAAAGR